MPTVEHPLDMHNYNANSITWASEFFS